MSKIDALQNEAKRILYAFFWVITQKKAYNIQNTAKAWNQERRYSKTDDSSIILSSARPSHQTDDCHHFLSAETAW